LQAVDDALRFTPNRYCVASMRVSLLRSLGRPGVEDGVVRSTAIFGNPDRDKIRGALYAFAGDRMRRVKNDALALHFYNRAIEADPRNAVGWRGRSKISFRGTPEQIPNGLIDIFMAAELDPLYTSRFLEMEGRMARFKHVMPLVREKVKWVTEHSPEVIGGLFVRGYLQFFDEDYAGAYQWFTKAFEASLKKSYFSVTYRGACLVRLGRLDAALEDLDLAESIFANGPVTEYWRACVYAKRGQDEKVLNSLRHLAETGFLFPNQLRDLHELRRFQSRPEVQRMIETAKIRRR
jgi:tetratricopeptide (TPR) repeat protein